MTYAGRQTEGLTTKRVPLAYRALTDTDGATLRLVIRSDVTRRMKKSREINASLSVLFGASTIKYSTTGELAYGTTPDYRRETESVRTNWNNNSLSVIHVDGDKVSSNTYSNNELASRYSVTAMEQFENLRETHAMVPNTEHTRINTSFSNEWSSTSKVHGTLYEHTRLSEHFRNETTTFTPSSREAISAAFLGNDTIGLLSRNDSWSQGSHSSDHFLDALHGYIVLVICFCGAVGNALTIAVLTRQRMRRTVSANETVVYYGLVLLSVTDFLFCLSVLPRAVVADGNIFHERGGFSMTYQLYCTGFITTLSLTSTWLIVVTAAVRYVGICHPLRARYLVSRRVVVTSLVAVVLLCVLVNLPTFWMHRVVDLSLGEVGNVTSSLYLIDLGEFSHETSKGYAFLWARMILAIFVPLLLLLYFNSCLIAALHRSDRFRRGSFPSSGRRSRAGSRRCCRGGSNGDTAEGGEEKEGIIRTHSTAEPSTRVSAKNRLTTVLVFIVLFFVLLVYPCEILDFLSHLTGIVHPDPEAFMIARLVTNVLQVSNFSFNFLLYCALNARFRATVSRLLFCRRGTGGARGYRGSGNGGTVGFCSCCCCPSAGRQCRLCGRCQRCGGRGTPERPLEVCSETNRSALPETTASMTVSDNRTMSPPTALSCVSADRPQGETAAVTESSE